MKRKLLLIVFVVLLALLAVLCCTAGCGRRARVIPDSKMKRIVAEMYLADQWVRDNPDGRKIADTTLFFDQIFRRYGYTFEDEQKDEEDKIQKATDKFIEKIDKLVDAKTNEIMTV